MNISNDPSASVNALSSTRGHGAGGATPTARIHYLGGYRTESMHLASGSEITTDAPRDNHGKGEAFSPTDLLATSLGQCILTTMAIAATADGLELAGSNASIVKIMASAPRRVAAIEVELHISGGPYTPEQVRRLEAVGRGCPISRSLSAELEQRIHFHWPAGTPTSSEGQDAQKEARDESAGQAPIIVQAS